ncbi:PIN domain-containing protein [Candidatus Woesearchaeota archaeon]|nr:PIN domain-containing protein [Candidatus Woesearchaeota archaeon]
MTEDFYFDTSIWLDVYEKRGVNGEKGFKLIEIIILDGKKIYYSTLNLKEFQALGYSQDEIEEILAPVKPNFCKKILFDKKQVLEAKKLSIQRKVSKSDSLHAVLARDNNLQLIARDHDFDFLKDISRAKKPEEFIED